MCHHFYSVETELQHGDRVIKGKQEIKVHFWAPTSINIASRAGSLLFARQRKRESKRRRVNTIDGRPTTWTKNGLSHLS